jgi:flavin reductase (DIM6/NTAB) family NADH-FMN oxidoreductase RutF
LGRHNGGMYIDFSEINARTAYYWLASTVTPRPVAWVSSLSADGVANLAPFSFFQVVTHTPPTLMICPLVNSDGSMKDTAANIAATGEFVVNLVPHSLVQQMNQTSFGYDRATSEWAQAGLTGLPSSKVKPQRVQGVPVSFECRRVSLTPYPAEAPSCYIILGEVLAAHIDESIVGANQQVDPMALDLVSRMGADWYGRTQSEANFELTRPAGWAR